MGRTPTRLLLAGTLVLAVALRAGGIGAFPHVDESQTVATAIFLEKSGAETPPSANWPPFLYSLLRGAIRVGVAVGLHPSTDAVAETFLTGWPRSVGRLHLEVRTVALLSGLATVALACLLGRRLAGEAGGLVAALSVAVSPLAVLASRGAVTDAPHALATTGALLLAVVHFDTGRRAPFLGSCALAGVAFSTKYLGVLAILAPFAAAALRRPADARAVAGRWALGALAALAAAFVAAPSLFLHPRAYLDWLRIHAEATDWEWLGFEGEPSGWIYHAIRTLPWSMGSVLLCAAAIPGLAFLVRREPQRAAVLLAFAIPYYLVVGRNRILYGRYLLPLIPLLGVLVAVGLGGAIRAALGRGRAALAARVLLGGLGFAAALRGEIDRARALRQTDTRILAARWMEERLAPGTRVLTAFPFFVPGYEFLPDFRYPPVPPARFRWETLAHATDRRARFDFAQAGKVADVYVWTSFADGLFARKPARYPDHAAFARALEAAPTLAVFDPGGRPDPLLPAAEQGSLGLAGRGCDRAGPRIRIVRLPAE